MIEGRFGVKEYKSALKAASTPVRAQLIVKIDHDDTLSAHDREVLKRYVSTLTLRRTALTNEGQDLTKRKRESKS